MPLDPRILTQSPIARRIQSARPAIREARVTLGRMGQAARDVWTSSQERIGQVTRDAWSASEALSREVTELLGIPLPLDLVREPKVLNAINLGLFTDPDELRQVAAVEAMKELVKSGDLTAYYLAAIHDDSAPGPVALGKVAPSLDMSSNSRVESVAMRLFGAQVGHDANGEPVPPEAAHKAATALLKAKALQIFGDLPQLNADATAEDFFNAGYWEELPRGLEEMRGSARYLPGQRVLVETRVDPKLFDSSGGREHGHVLDSQDGTFAITHPATLAGEEGDDFLVKVDGRDEPLRVSKASVFRLNEPDRMEGQSVPLGNADADYTSPLMKAKIAEAALRMAPLIEQLDFTQAPESTVDLQKSAVSVIHHAVDMLYPKGDASKAPGRVSTRDVRDAGRQAVLGAGTPYDQACVTAALLAPFRDALGVDVQLVSGRGVRGFTDNESHLLEVGGAQRRGWLRLSYRPSMELVGCDRTWSQLRQIAAVETMKQLVKSGDLTGYYLAAIHEDSPPGPTVPGKVNPNLDMSSDYRVESLAMRLFGPQVSRDANGEPVPPDAARKAAAALLKQRALRLFAALPQLNADATAEGFVDAGYWEELPHGLEEMRGSARYLPGREVLVETHVDPKLFDASGFGENRHFLAYEERGPIAITHRATLAGEDGDDFLVKVDGRDEPLRISKSSVFKLNQPDRLSGQTLDLRNATADYRAPLMKAKIAEAALRMAPLIEQLDFTQASQASDGGPYAWVTKKPMVSLQKSAVRVVHDAVDMLYPKGDALKVPGRISAREVSDAGRQAVRGVGICYDQACVMAALLAPFRDALGVDVQLVSGHVLRSFTDNKANPLVPGRPESHGWLHLSYRPSLELVICDRTWTQPDKPPYSAYSRWGDRHMDSLFLDSRPLGNRLPPTPTDVNMAGDVTAREFDRQFGVQGQDGREHHQSFSQVYTN